MKWKYFTSFFCMLLVEYTENNAEEYILLVLTYVINVYKYREKNCNWNNF